VDSDILARWKISSPPSKPSEYAIWPLETCRCVDLSRQHRVSYIIVFATTALPYSDSTRTKRVLRHTSSSAFGLSSHPLLPRHVCHSSRTRHLVQHSTGSKDSPGRPPYPAIQLVGHMLRRHYHPHSPGRQESAKQQAVPRGLDHVLRPVATLRAHGVRARSTHLRN
jgi:hypothetical protein